MDKKKNISLVVLAAGMGSRYGGLKQLDAFGPDGESIIDYSIYDAIKAGFDRVVFIVRESFQERFRDIFDAKLGHLLELAYVNQELDQLPQGYTLPEGREKPWGTAHAMLAAKDAIDGPFCIINGDDFYGHAAFYQMYDFLTNEQNDAEDIYSMVGYQIANTLSKFGSVSRGICDVDGDGYLTKVEETHKIHEELEKKLVCERNGKIEELDYNAVVSMNMWGAFPSIMAHTEEDFKRFLDEFAETPKSEFYIPLVIDNMIKRGTAKVKVLYSEAKWFGVTYKEDKEEVRARLLALIEKGQYPRSLWPSQ